MTTLSQTCIERLTILADYMEGLHNKRFTMSKIAHECGSPACAFGHALCLPEFKKMGLTNDGIWLLDAKDFFDFPSAFTSEELFDSDLSATIHTPQQWAAHCRKWLAEHGAILPTKKDEISKKEIDGSFERFLELVLEPVDSHQ